MCVCTSKDILIRTGLGLVNHIIKMEKDFLHVPNDEMCGIVKFSVFQCFMKIIKCACFSFVLGTGDDVGWKSGRERGLVRLLAI